MAAPQRLQYWQVLLMVVMSAMELLAPASVMARRRVVGPARASGGLHSRQASHGSWCALRQAGAHEAGGSGLGGLAGRLLLCCAEGVARRGAAAVPTT